MTILPYEQQYAAQIADLLNQFLPFEPETAETVHNAFGTRFLCLNDKNEVVGYIAGHLLTDFTEDFPYFYTELQPLRAEVTAQPAYYTSHFVVHPEARNQGIGSRLVEHYTEAVSKVAKTIVTVGWVQSDMNTWAAQGQFVRAGYASFLYMPRYFEPYNVHCPSCDGLCYCDAHIFIKNV